MKAEIELIKKGEVVVLDFDVIDEYTGEFEPLSLQRFSEDTGEPLPLVDAGNLVITDYIHQQLTEALRAH
tara:strand:+ start:220 stop:429 length:210 start_codon:yes stop_codon:yes gene_type:complete